MADAGYGHALLNKGRMRNATFWREQVLELVTEVSMMTSTSTSGG